MDNNNFVPGTAPIKPEPQPVPPQPGTFAQPGPTLSAPVEPPAPQPVAPQPQPVAPGPQPVVPQPQPVVPEPQPIIPENPIASPSEPKKKNHLVPIIIFSIFGLVAVALIVLLFLRPGGNSISAASVRNVCNKYNLTIEEETNESPKAGYIQCSTNSTTQPVYAISYTYLLENSLNDYDEFTSGVYSIATTYGTTVENDEFKKIYFGSEVYGGLGVGYIIIEDKAYITISGSDEKTIRAALIEIGYPDRNWATEESSENGQSGSSSLQIAQRNTARRNDMARVDTSLVQYQTNNSTKKKNLPDAGTMAPQTSAAFPDNCASDAACSFIRNYMNAGFADGVSTNEFQDPDGVYYGMTIQDFDTTYTASGRFNYQTVAGTNDMNHIIYVLTGAKCDGEEAVHDTSRHFAIIYRLEDATTYCIDDQ